jgi:hypothetical protein
MNLAYSVLTPSMPATPTDLIDRYAAAIARHLPPDKRAAVTGPIVDELRAQVRETEAHNGRAMTEDEVAALIRMRGNPYLIAQPHRTGRYLFIGPGLLPQYWRALRTTLTIAFLAIVVLAAVLAVDGRSPAALASYVSVFLRLAFYLVIVVSIAFAVIDIVQGRVLLKQQWDPRELTAPAVESSIGGGGSLADVATSGVFLVWWLAVPHYPWVLLGPGARYFDFSDGWRAAHGPVTVCFVASFLIHVIAVVRPRWTWLARWRTVLANAASLLGAGLLLGAGTLLVPSPASHFDEPTLALVDRAIRWCLVWTMLVAAVQSLRDAFRAWRRGAQTS